MNDEELREFFLELRDEPVPAESLARVRIAVNQRLESRRRFGMWRWGLAAGLAATACLAAWSLMPGRGLPAQLPARIESSVLPQPPAPEPIPQQAPVPRRQATVRTRPVRIEHPVPRPAESSEGAREIRIESPDSDVVLVLIGG